MKKKIYALMSILSLLSSLILGGYSIITIVSAWWNKDINYYNKLDYFIYLVKSGLLIPLVLCIIFWFMFYYFGTTLIHMDDNKEE